MPLFYIRLPCSKFYRAWTRTTDIWMDSWEHMNKQVVRYLAITPLCLRSFYPLQAHSPVYASDHFSYVCRWFKFHVTPAHLAGTQNNGRGIHPRMSSSFVGDGHFPLHLHCGAHLATCTYIRFILRIAIISSRQLICWIVNFIYRNLGHIIHY